MTSRTLYRYGTVAAVTVLIALFAAYIATQNKTSIPPQESADSALGQYAERPNAPLPAESPESDSSGASASLAKKPSTLVPGCSLHFSFSPQEKLVAPDSSVDYSLTVVNMGTQACKNTSFSIYYSENEMFVSAAPRPTASTYYWLVGSLDSGKVFTALVHTKQHSKDGSDQISNEACATADNSKDICADNVIFVGAGGSAAIAAPTTAPPTHSATPVTPSGGGAALSAPQGKELGVWVWTSPMQMDASYTARMLEEVKDSGFTSVYITIDDYLSIAAMPDGPIKDVQKKKYTDTLASLVIIANAKGINVDVEGGARDWALPENRWKGFALIDFVQAYNIAYPKAQVRGFQYDVEVYLLPQYEDHKAEVLTQYVEFIDQSAARMQATNAQFTVVIPHFYDSTQQWTPAITYAGKTTYMFTQLLNVLQKKSGSRMIIMAYRNFFDGTNGTYQLSQAEIREASGGSYSTNIIVAQETGDVDPSYVTFHGLTRAALAAALGDITAVFSSYSNYGGVAVHYLDPFLQLK